MAEDLKERIRARYGAAARGEGGCCGTTAQGCQAPATAVRLTDGLYAADELAALPAGAVGVSLGCGNPTALAHLAPGETVLDLGSGGGIDVLLSARRVGPNGKAYGLDMTDDMLTLARANQQQSGVSNAEFLKGDIEAIPLPENHVDVVISNCVINLAADKDKVFQETFRVLKPGGRLAVTDLLWRGARDQVPQALLRNLEAWVGCVAGALTEAEYLGKLAAAGFTDVSVETVRVYDKDYACSLGAGALVAGVPDGVQLISGFVRARKP